MWLHIIGFDPKFITQIKSLYECVDPKRNIYAVFVDTDDVTLSGDEIVIKCASDFRALVQSRTDWDGIIFNPIMTYELGFMKFIPKGIPVVNSIWGFEFYRHHWALSVDHLYLPQTKAIVNSMDHRPAWRRVAKLIKESFRLYTVCRKVNICYGPIKEEFDLLRSLRIFSKKTIGMFGVVGLTEQVEAPAIQEDSNNILLGNSSTPTNNHIEAIDRLADLDLRGRKVIVPLSYGIPEYREIVVRHGYAKLGERFQPLLDFIPFPDYSRLIASCDVVIMNNLRQQAVGNILLALESGAKLFLNPTPVFHCLERLGAHVECVDRVNTTTLHTRLSAEQVAKNRSVFQNNFSSESRIRAMQAILKQCRTMKQEMNLS